MYYCFPTYRVNSHTNSTSLNILEKSAPAKCSIAVHAHCVKDSPRPFTTARHGKRAQVVKRQSVIKKTAFFHFQAFQSSLLDRDDDSKESHRRSYLFGLPLIGTYIDLAMRYGPLNPFELAIDTPRFIFENFNRLLFFRVLFEQSQRADANDVERWARAMKLTGNTQLVNHSGTQMSMFGVSFCPYISLYLLYSHPQGCYCHWKPWLIQSFSSRRK